LRKAQNAAPVKKARTTRTISNGRPTRCLREVRMQFDFAGTTVLANS
jgi:hypothetical protein